MSTIGYYICVPFAWLVRLFYNLTNSYGVALILFTLVIKLIMLPFQMKSKKSMMRMSRVSGQMQDLQKRYAKNQAKLQEEMQKLYEEEGITAQDPAESHPAALQGAVFFNGFQRVLRTGRGIAAAGRPKRRNSPAVEPHQSQKNPLHTGSFIRSTFRHRRRNCFCSSGQGAVAVLLRATRIISYPVFSWGFSRR